MIDVRDLRFWTALAMIGVAALAIRPALRLVGFGYVETFDATPARLAAYDDVPGAGSFAREEALRQEPASEAALALAQGLVARRPLASGDWLGLARLDIVGQADLQSGLAAAALSNVTGPNEGGLMAGRAALLVPLWSLLPAGLRRTAAMDLVAGWGMLSPLERKSVIGSARSLAPADQANLKAALLLQGAGAKGFLTVLGLADAAPAASAGDAASARSEPVAPERDASPPGTGQQGAGPPREVGSGALAGSKAILTPDLRPVISGGADSRQ